MEQTINGNLSQCIQYANSVGGTTYYNICSGASHWVPWGSLDWLGAVAGSIFIGALIAGTAALIFVISRT